MHILRSGPAWQVQVQLKPLQDAMRCLQYHSKACAAELDQSALGASDSPRKTVLVQELQQKRQALNQCIADKRAEVSSIWLANAMNASNPYPLC